MSPVVRMSDDVFRRLQRISEPLVDTPSQVIDRILSYYEKSAIAVANSSRVEDAINPRIDRSDLTPETTAEGHARLFIAPVTDANLRRTILNTVDLATVENFLTEHQRQEVAGLLGNHRQFHCWALTESRRSVFDAMRAGDVVVLITPLTAFVCRVQHKLISESLGNHLWPNQPRLPWKYVYLVTDVRELRVRKSLLNRALGYKPSHVFPGVSRVRAEALRSALDQNGGSIDQLLARCSA
jgi:hypothetical protein